MHEEAVASVSCLAKGTSLGHTILVFGAAVLMRELGALMEHNANKVKRQ